MTTHNPNNERVKRQYFIYLKEAARYSEPTVDAVAAAKVSIALTRLGLGNFSNVKGVGLGVYEYKIDFGPGYRVYFGKDGETLVILLGGGTKNRQSKDILAAQACWID